MKHCAHCGHGNLDDATRCDDCGWAVPKAHPLAKAGTILKIVAAIGFIAVVVIHLAVVMGNHSNVVSEDDLHWQYSFPLLLFGTGVAAITFWIGDYLKRTH